MFDQLLYFVLFLCLLATYLVQYGTRTLRTYGDNVRQDRTVDFADTHILAMVLTFSKQQKILSRWWYFLLIGCSH
jgi:hypothetical protein